jgi:hypothetical protein
MHVLPVPRAHQVLGEAKLREMAELNGDLVDRHIDEITVQFGHLAEFRLAQNLMCAGDRENVHVA